MPTVRFVWSPLLVEGRREVCPRAKWLAAQKAWAMSEDEARTFIAAGHVRLEYARMHCQIVVDQERWLIGLVQGAPCKTVTCL